LGQIFLIVAKFAKSAKIVQKRQKEKIILHTVPQKPKIIEVQTCTNIAHDVKMMPELFGFK